MKKVFIVLLALLPIAMAAQDNAWEKTIQNQNDEIYLAGAVPVIDGKVTFQTTIKVPGKTRQQIHALLLDYLTKMTKEEGQFEQSRIVLDDNENKKQVVGSYQEWLVFKNKPLNLDRTRLFYHIIADCQDGEANIKMTRIYYLYDEERDPQTYQAEEWITDRYGLNKKQTKLARVSGKFRRKTIDRKNYLFEKFEQLLTR
jgi:colicin import membrane protein